MITLKTSGPPLQCRPRAVIAPQKFGWSFSICRCRWCLLRNTWMSIVLLYRTYWLEEIWQSMGSLAEQLQKKFIALCSYLKRFNGILSAEHLTTAFQLNATRCHERSHVKNTKNDFHEEIHFATDFASVVEKRPRKENQSPPYINQIPVNFFTLFSRLSTKFWRKN